MYLMLCDKEVLYFNLDEFVVYEMAPNLVPYSIRGSFKSDDSMRSVLHNVETLKSYLSSRVLSMNRDNAKLLYSAFRLSQIDSIDDRLKICLLSNGVSVTDSYWIKQDNSNVNFSHVNIRKNKFSEIVDIALVGVNPTISVDYLNPELTTHGLFRKAWSRIDGELHLLKSDRHEYNINTKMEVLASDMLSCFGNRIDSVVYKGEYVDTQNGRLYVSRCKNFVGEEYSFVEAWQVMEYAKRVGVSYTDEILGYSGISSSIGVLDYVLSNTDRHTQNYGFLMDNHTGLIIGLAPLFDFNCALVSDVFRKNVEDTLSQMFNDGRSLLDVAMHYRNYSKLELNFDMFFELRERYVEFDYVFENVLLRCKNVGVKFV